jgi:replicative DNA helicase
MHDHNEIEEAWLSCCLQDPEHIDKGVGAGLTNNHFKHRPHGELWRLLCELRLSGTTCDANGVVSAAVQRGVAERAGGVAGILGMEGKVSSPAITGAAMLPALLDLHAKREIWTRCATVTEQLKSGAGNLEEIRPLLDEAAQYCTGQSRAPARTVDDLDRELEAQIAAAKENKPRTDLIGWGLSKLDKYMDPIGPHEYVLICARPSVGKSSMLANLALTALRNKQRVCVFTLETSDTSVYRQMVAQSAGVNMKRIQDWFPTDHERVKKVRDAIRDSKRFMVFDRDMTLEAITSRCRLLATTFKPNLVILDYLGLVSTDGDNIYQRVSKVSKAMIPLRKTLGCALVVGQQLNRGSQAENREPTLADLRDSGQLEEDAHRVVMLHWKDSRLLDQETRQYKILQPKCRDGVTTAVDGIEFHAPTTRWREAIAP